MNAPDELKRSKHDDKSLKVLFLLTSLVVDVVNFLISVIYQKIIGAFSVAPGEFRTECTELVIKSTPAVKLNPEGITRYKKLFFCDPKLITPGIKRGEEEEISSS